MPNILKISLIGSVISFLISPLVGWGLAQTNLPALVAFYCMVLILGWPIGVIGWFTLGRGTARDDHSA